MYAVRKTCSFSIYLHLIHKKTNGRGRGFRLLAEAEVGRGRGGETSFSNRETDEEKLGLSGAYLNKCFYSRTQKSYHVVLSSSKVTNWFTKGLFSILKVKLTSFESI